MDISLVSAVSTNLNTGLQIAKAILSMKVDAEVISKTNELRSLLASAMGQLLDLQSARIVEQSRVRELEDKVRELETKLARQATFDADAGRYELRAIGEGAIVYALKAAAAKDGEPEHWLCASCFEQQKKSILQYAKADLAAKIYACPNCSTQIRAPNPAAGEIIQTVGPRRSIFDGY